MAIHEVSSFSLTEKEFFYTSPIALLETIQRANNIEILYKIRLKFSFQFHTARAQPRPNRRPSDPASS